MEHEDVLRSRMDELRTLMRKLRIDVTFESLSESVFQGIVSRGDRRVGALIRKIASPDETLRRALKELPRWATESVYKQRIADEVAPWDFVDGGVGKKHLLSEYHQGLTARKTTACRPAKCRACEACGGR